MREIGGSSGVGSAGGASGATYERSKTGPSLKRVLGLPAGSLPPAAERSSSCSDGGIGTHTRSAVSPRRTQEPSLTHARKPATRVASRFWSAMSSWSARL